MKQNIAKTAVFATLGLFLGLMLASVEAKAVTVNTGESVRVDFDLTQLTSYDPAAVSRFSGFFTSLSDVAGIKIKAFNNNVLIKDYGVFNCGPGCAGGAFATFYEYGVFGSGPVHMVFSPTQGTFDVDAIFEQFDFFRSSQVPEEGEFVMGTAGEPSAVPLPAALPLFATSVAALAFVARRRRKAVLAAA
jgi:hypothetical protein